MACSYKQLNYPDFRISSGQFWRQHALASTSIEQARVTVCNARFGIALNGDVDTLAPLGVDSIPTLAMGWHDRRAGAS